MFRDALLGKFTVSMLVDYLGDTSLRTVQRWYASDKAPRAVVLMIRMLKGELGIIHPDWQGWSIGKDGLLYSPEGRHVQPGELRALQYQGARIRALENRVKELTEQPVEPGRLIKIRLDK